MVRPGADVFAGANRLPLATAKGGWQHYGSRTRYRAGRRHVQKRRTEEGVRINIRSCRNGHGDELVETE